MILLKAGAYALTRTGAGEDAAALGDLDILDDVTLLGEGASSTLIDALSQDRVLHVLNGQTADVRGVQLRHGSVSGAGGAVLNAGTLTLTQSVVTQSTAGGAGGAIENTGTLKLFASTVSDNQAGTIGGALHASGDVEIVNSTLSGNRASGAFGGGLYFIANTAAEINNSTIAFNTSTGKGGGLFAESSAFIGQNAPRLTNSILAKNTSGSEADCSGAPLSGGHNLLGLGGGCGDFSAAKSDLLGTGAGLDPGLAALTGNGGPTPTHAIGTGSSARNAGDADSCAADDQRGADRPAGGGCDIGAFEDTTACVAGGSTLCLNNGRFKVTANWKAPTGQGVAQAQTLTPDTGYLWFFDPANVEVTIKVLNGCGFNNRYWVFVSGLTNVQVDLTVTDTQSGASKVYSSPQGSTFRTSLDSNAFATCP